MNQEHLLKEAKIAQKYARLVHSDLKVGAVLETRDGKIFSGCNIENDSMGLSICAERVALFKAVSEGYTDIKSIAITSSLGKIFPCGSCRQFLAEFGTDIEVFLEDDPKTYKISELLPQAFSYKSS